MKLDLSIVAYLFIIWAFYLGLSLTTAFPSWPFGLLIVGTIIYIIKALR